jgi:hypothetical protein
LFAPLENLRRGLNLSCRRPFRHTGKPVRLTRLA